MAETVIEVEDATVRYNGLKVLDSAAIRVNRGDVVGIVGPNGGGKSTLLKAMLGIVKLDSGSVKLFGKPISKFHEFHKIGYVAQNAIQFDPLFPASVEEIVSLGCITRKRLGRPLTREDRKNVERALEMVDLLPYKDRRISDLSGGQKQRIFIAKALVKKPEVLLLDEVTAGLDICITDKFTKLMRKLKKETDLTAVMVSHDLSGVFCQANKVAVVNRRVHVTDISEGTDPDSILRKGYGEHFTFMFHHDQMECRGDQL